MILFECGSILREKSITLCEHLRFNFFLILITHLRSKLLKLSILSYLSKNLFILVLHYYFLSNKLSRFKETLNLLYKIKFLYKFFKPIHPFIRNFIKEIIHSRNSTNKILLRAIFIIVKLIIYSKLFFTIMNLSINIMNFSCKRELLMTKISRNS